MFSLGYSIGGTTRFITLLTLVLHFLHPFLNVITYLVYIRHNRDVIGKRTSDAYAVLMILASVSFVAISSMFYMWAWHYPEPEEHAKRRRAYGICFNFFLSDLPMFCVETTIVWDHQFASVALGVSYIVTVISFVYSLTRVWFLAINKLLRQRAPMVAAGMPLYDRSGAGAVVIPPDRAVSVPASISTVPIVSPIMRNSQNTMAGGIVPPSIISSPGNGSAYGSAYGAHTAMPMGFAP